MSKHVHGQHVRGRRDCSGQVAGGASGGAAAGGASGSVAAGGASGRRVRVRVVVRASGRQRGSVVRGSVRVRERVVVSASGQAAKAARKSRDEIRLG